jgi:hypothetical protein
MPGTTARVMLVGSQQHSYKAAQLYSQTDDGFAVLL